jgi:hypothetical protein
MTTLSKPLEIEGVQINIEWGKFITGSSFFVPCLDNRAVVTHIVMVAKSFDMKVQCRARIENGMWGVRAWRVA